MKVRIHEARDAQELAKLLGLTPSHAAEWKVRSDLAARIAVVAAKSGRTHAEIAKLAQTSRTRVTAILNGNVTDISTDLMLRVATALGYEARVTLRKISAA